MDKNKKHTIKVVVDRVVIKEGVEGDSPIRSRPPCA